MKAIVLFALFLNVADGHKNLRSLSKQNNVQLLNTHNDDDQTDISIYTSDFFDKAEEFKTLSQQKDDEKKNTIAEEKKKEQDEINAKNKIQNEIEDLKKQIKEKQSKNSNIISKKPVPITEIEMNVDAKELEEYTQQVTDKAENSEPEEAVIYSNSAPKSKPDVPAMDVLDIDISDQEGTLKQQHQYFLEDTSLLQIKEDEPDFTNVEIDGGETEDAAAPVQEEEVQTDQEASNLVIEQANSVQEISENALKDVENGTEPPEEPAQTSPELNEFMETTAEDQEAPAAEEEAPAAASSQTQEQTDNIKAFGEKLGIEMPSSLFELSDNESISAGLVEAAVNAGKSEDEIGAALAG